VLRGTRSCGWQASRVTSSWFASFDDLVYAPQLISSSSRRTVSVTITSFSTTRRRTRTRSAGRH